ncbi:zinc finger protein VAR3, chloroplastic-like [Rhodamnia argentea]|uniref:Zinc finger protein VAR3, chloroplastic-like n=1 Tax=Rhodamnia argentea TaxID=178133 RepID=A0A8B8QZJ5_9MYRT|nr:zinc finger protein VAR3, chloroplastic-like [Rhodamnia argentea]
MGGATRFLMLLATPIPPRCPSLLRLARLNHHRRHLRHLSPLTSLHHHILNASTDHSRPLRIKSSSRHFHAQTNAVRHDHFSDSAHPWSEWLDFVRSLSAGGYFGKEGFAAVAARGIGGEAEFLAGVDLHEEFVRAAEAGLAFARDRPHLLRELSKRDIDVLVENGPPLLFKNADDSIRKMRAFMSGDEAGTVDGNKAQTIDLMRFILSYACSPLTTEKSYFSNQIFIASVRNLLQEMANFNRTSPSNFAGSLERQFSGGYGQVPRPRGPNIEMKRGDWICPRCSFMNFARNMKCLECEEARPKGHLTGREWGCPQCDFFNNGRNQICLRCECKRPGQMSSTVPSGFGSGHGSVDDATKVDIETRLAANEEKAQRWFKKVSQLVSTADVYSAMTDEDFPEIMPLRKGVNRFVVSTKKTPLDRRLADAQNRSNFTAEVTPKVDDNRISDANKRLDSSFSNSPSPQQGQPGGNNSGYVAFRPLPDDMFAKKPGISETEADNTVTGGAASLASNAREQDSPASGFNVTGKSGACLPPSHGPVFETEKQDQEKGREEKSEGWFRRIAELHDARDLPSAVSDQDFSKTMPVRKGENRFAVGRMKDHSSTSPMYKRRAAMERASNTNFVPFVPFPPGHFAKKENRQPDGENATDKASLETTSTLASPRKLPLEANDSSSMPPNGNVQSGENRQIDSGTRNMKPTVENFTQNSSTMTKGTHNVGMLGDLSNPQTNSGSSGGAGSFQDGRNPGETTNEASSSHQPSESFNVREQWRGKSLEGSAVKEPDPLDMSEEAKAERWFRRVAQIKDISELSQIPDEDFPSIMPMRKGVNRFVVSKRKTPLERRLTSSQYRRNLPVVTSDPVKNEE